MHLIKLVEHSTKPSTSSRCLLGLSSLFLNHNLLLIDKPWNINQPWCRCVLVSVCYSVTGLTGNEQEEWRCKKNLRAVCGWKDASNCESRPAAISRPVTHADGKNNSPSRTRNVCVFKNAALLLVDRHRQVQKAWRRRGEETKEEEEEEKLHRTQGEAREKGSKTLQRCKSEEYQRGDVRHERRRKDEKVGGEDQRRRRRKGCRRGDCLLKDLEERRKAGGEGRWGVKIREEEKRLQE